MAALIPNLSFSTLMSVVHLLEMHVSNERAKVHHRDPFTQGHVMPVVYGQGDEMDSMHFATLNNFVAALLYDMERSVFRVLLGRFSVEQVGAENMFMEYSFSLHSLEERKPLTYEFSVEQSTHVAEVLFHHLVLQDTQVLYRENVASGLQPDTFEALSNNYADREAELQLEQGSEHPYAGQPPQDLAERIVNGVLYNLGDRRGIRGELGNVDIETRQQIVSSLANIVRVGLKKEAQ